MSDTPFPTYTAVEALSRAHGEVLGEGLIRSVPEDFVVDEDLGFEPDGEGDHALLHVRKRGANTDWVAKTLAKAVGVKPLEVGYAGLKDRHAVTTQWFSVNLAGREERNWAGLTNDEFEVIAAHRHRRKLRRGALRGNRFTLTIRDVRLDEGALAARLDAIATRGVPNYFAQQRFGHDEANLAQAHRLFAGASKRLDRHKRGLYLSAARSQLFNEVLAVRVQQDNWDRLLAGDVAALEGSHSWFPVPEVTEELRARAEAMDIHPSGPLWGRGRSPAEGIVAELERDALTAFPGWAEGLERFGLNQERRSLRLKVDGLTWTLRDDVVTLSFHLPAGAYATAVLRECLDVREGDRAGASA